MAEDFLKAQSPDLHVLSDPEGTLAQGVGSQGIPTSILIDEAGAVLAIHVGSMTPAHIAFMETVAQHPGVGRFDAADYPDFEPLAELPEVSAEDAAPIEPDETVSGSLDDETFFEVYRFEGAAGDRIDARLMNAGGDLEPYLVLLDEDGDRVAESRDYFYEPVAALDEIELPADGTYLLVATRFLEADGMSAGDYDLIFRLVEDRGSP
jgi:hypothetical protein